MNVPNEMFDPRRTTMATPHVESLLENVSRQMTFSKLNRHSSNRAASERRCPRSMEAKRILKVSSTGNSPRKNERRRFFNSAFSSQRSSFIEGVRQHQASIAFRQSTQQSRPTTWHPAAQPDWDAIEMTRSSPVQPQPPFLTTDSWNYSYHTPTSMPQYAPITPIQTVTSDTHLNQHQHYELQPVSYQVQQPPPWQSQYHQPNFYPQLNNSLYPFDATSQPYLDYQTPNSSFPFDSVPSTPENVFTMQKSSFLFDSDQLFDQVAKPDEENTGAELIGMGLYDDRKEPAARAVEFDSDPSVMMSRLLSSTDLALGKGLKLEETWEPPEDDQENAESDASDDERAEEEEAEELPVSGILEQQHGLDLSNQPQLAEDGTLVVAAHAVGSLDGGWI